MNLAIIGSRNFNNKKLLFSILHDYFDKFDENGYSWYSKK